MKAQTLFEKIWQRHLVVPETSEHPAILYIDCHLVHEVTSPQAFTELRTRGLKVRRTDRTFATLDHSIPTDSERSAYLNAATRHQVQTLRENCQEFAVPLFDLDSGDQGIVHVMGPELGLTLPGSTIVCGDSHTATHGAFGALAFGIGTSEVGHVLATQCLLQSQPKTMAVYVKGSLGPGVSAKDLILEIIRTLGFAGGTGYVLEYKGEAISAMSMEERMTLCNMTIEAGARAGLIAPDATTFAYLKGRRFAPKDAAWDAALSDWIQLSSDPQAVYDAEITIDAAALTPMVTYGTSPDQAVGIQARIPAARSPSETKALAYMQLESEQRMEGIPVDVVFIGSCTNGRLSDLRAAAQVFSGRQKAPQVRVLVVPGSQAVKKAAEEEGLDVIFRDAGAEWREPGCSLCIAMNGDQLEPGQCAVSTSNRNFAGRQGKGARTILASPVTAAAAAIAGCVTDPRPYLF